MVSSGMEATFGFVDLAGFAALTEVHGDHAAADLVEHFTQIVGELLPGDGRLVKTIGDAVLVTIPTPAVALDFVERLWTRATAEAGFPTLRAGLHHGEAVERAGDVFGAAINLAARVTSHAGGGEVLATQGVAEAARAQHRHVRALGPVALKNLGLPVELFAIACGAGIERKAIDPVCRMRVDPESAVGHLRIDETDFWFCSLDCIARFSAHPSRFILARTT